MKKLWTLLTLLLLVTQITAQTVLIDSINKTTLFDREATIITGQLLKRGDILDTLNLEKTILIDSLYSQINLHKKETQEYKEVIVPTLKSLVEEKENEMIWSNHRSTITIDSLEMDLKVQKKKKWWWALVSLLVGTGFGFALGL